MCSSDLYFTPVIPNPATPVGPANLLPTAIEIAPTNSSVFPWLSHIAHAFQQYRFSSMTFQYNAMSSAMEHGCVLMGVRYGDALTEVLADLPETRPEFLDLEDSDARVPWKSFDLHVNSRLANSVPFRSVHRHADSKSTDSTDPPPPVFLWGTQDVPLNTQTGDIWCDYTIQFFGSKAPKGLVVSNRSIHVNSSITASMQADDKMFENLIPDSGLVYDVPISPVNGGLFATATDFAPRSGAVIARRSLSIKTPGVYRIDLEVPELAANRIDGVGRSIDWYHSNGIKMYRPSDKTTNNVSTMHQFIDGAFVVGKAMNYTAYAVVKSAYEWLYPKFGTILTGLANPAGGDLITKITPASLESLGELIPALALEKEERKTTGLGKEPFASGSKRVIASEPPAPDGVWVRLEDSKTAYPLNGGHP